MLRIWITEMKIRIPTMAGTTPLVGVRRERDPSRRGKRIPIEPALQAPVIPAQAGI